MRNVTAIVVSAVCGCLLTCSNPSGPHSGLDIVSGAGLTDTVGAFMNPPLTVVLLDDNLLPMSGQAVYFNTNGFVLVAPRDDAGFVINRLPVTTDASGYASVLVFSKAPGTGKVVIVAPSGQSLDVYYTVLPGAPAYVRADPSDTAVYVGGSVTFRPYLADASGNRVNVSSTYQYQSLNTALTISAPGKATGAAIGRGAVAVSALGFTDTVWASVVPKGRVVAQVGYIVLTNLDGSAFHTIPSSYLGGHALDWSRVTRTLLFDTDGPEYLVAMDTAGHTRRVVTDALMRSEYYPRFTQDESYIYFTGNDSVTTCYGVWRIHPDGTGLEHVVADTSDCGVYVYGTAPSPDYASSPSPDGTRVVYVNQTLRVRTLATGADTSLGVVGDVPRWSPTGEWIAYDSLGTVMLIRPDGTGHRTLLYRGDVPYFPGVAWSPDGQWLIYTGYDQPTRFNGLKIVQIATGLEMPLPFAGGLRDPAWQP